MALKQVKGGTPGGDIKERAPAMLKIDPDKIGSSAAKAIVERLVKAIPPLAEKIKESDFTGFSKKDPKEIGNALENYVTTIIFLDQNSMFLSRDLLLEPDAIRQIFSHDAWKVYQLASCVFEFDSDISCHLFISNYLPNMGKNIYWKPFLDKLLEYDEQSVVLSLGFGDDFEKYLLQWDQSVVMAEEAVCRFGFISLPQLQLGRHISVEIGSDQSFSTTNTGKITIPPYVAMFETKDDNLESYHVSFWHEIGHHKWKTFELNMHPDIFDYASFGLRFISHRKVDGAVAVTAEKIDGTDAGKTIDIRSLSDLSSAVKYPKLLHALHNWIDDGRVDSNNKEHCRGLSASYSRDCELLFIKRPGVSDPELASLLEAILQYSIMGKTRSAIAPQYAGAFEKAKAIIDDMEWGLETDGTASMNAAIKVYRMLESEIADFEKGIEKAQMPKGMRSSSTEVGKDNPPRLKAEPGQKGKQRKRMGVRPEDFLENENPDPQQNGKSGSGEPSNKSSKGGKPSGKSREDKSSDDQKGQGGKDKNEDEDGKTGNQPQENNAFHYDGWDGQRYVLNEHAVFEEEAEGRTIESDPDDAQHIKNIFKQHAPKQGVLVRGTYEGEPDSELVAEYMHNLRCGRLGERNFYSQVLYEERDVATGVLIDLSGSTTGIRDEIIQSCYAIGIASQVLNDPLIVAGFTCDGKGESFIVMKDIEDPSIKGSDKGGGTPMGGPLRHMCQKMKQPKAVHKGFKQVFLITDGEANVGKSPMDDAAKAVEDAWKIDRIKVIGIGIISGEPGTEAYDSQYKMMEEQFDKIFGYGNHIIVSDGDVRSGRLHNFFEECYRKTVHMLR